jgi:hypothetical protein
MNEGLGKPSFGYYHRIIEINENELKMLVRSEGNSWDSGFVEEQKYFAQEL